MSQEDRCMGLDKRTIAFDNLLPETPAQLEVGSRRITVNKPSGTWVIAVEPTNPFHKAIFKALAKAFQTSWFNGLVPKSQTGHLRRAQQFFDWIDVSGYLSDGENCYACLKDFEAHRMNVDGIKRSPLILLRAAIEKGLDADSVSEADYRYLRTLLRLTKLAREPEAIPHTLTDWFNLPWLRAILGEQKYLSLESPSRLFSSFRITVATTLAYLLEIREFWKGRPNLLSEPIDQKEWVQVWDSRFLRELGTFDINGNPADELTELMWLDMVADHEKPILKRLIAERGIESIIKQPTLGKRFYPWRCPSIFHPDNRSTYAPIEELLMAWLVACEAVQPEDIQKLKTTDYACEFNSSGRLMAMQCCYYKGRAGPNREPAMLISSDCWTKAQFAYLNGLPDFAQLFRHNIGRQMVVPDFGGGSKSVNTRSIQITLFRLWQMPRLQTRIRAAIKRADSLPIFLEAMLALTRGSQSYNCYSLRNKGASHTDYEAAVARPLPHRIFTLTHVKNTAVHAGSDRYREGDLINHHSHTSATEKHHYLTDANKDFVNRAGRITRVVLHDLQKVVYQPSISAITQAVNDLELQSQVVEATGSEDAGVNPIDLPASRSETGDIFLIPDTISQALIFIHAIAEAEQRYERLLTLRPDWVERTLLPQLEWMSRTLTRMRSAAAAQEQYSDLKLHLPPVFDHLLETHE